MRTTDRRPQRWAMLRRLGAAVGLALAVALLPTTAWASSYGGYPLPDCPASANVPACWITGVDVRATYPDSTMVHVNVQASTIGQAYGVWTVEGSLSAFPVPNYQPGYTANVLLSVHCAEGPRHDQWYYSGVGSDSVDTRANGGVKSFLASMPQDECTRIDAIGIDDAAGRTPGTWTVAIPADTSMPKNPVVDAGNCAGSDSQLVGLLAAAGWINDADGRTALAVLLAESGGQVNALHQNANGSYDVGLFQINTTAHADLDADRLGVDPLYNVTNARTIRTADGWAAWSTYTSGAYVKYRDRAAAAWAGPADPLPATSCEQLTGHAAGAAGDDGTDCSGWNPVTYLKCLFVPKSSTIDQFGGLSDQLKTAVPFSYVIGAVSVMNNATRPCSQPVGGLPSGCAEWSGLTVNAPAWYGGGTNSTFTVLAPGSDLVNMLRSWRGALELASWAMVSAPIVFYVWRKLMPAVDGE